VKKSWSALCCGFVCWLLVGAGFPDTDVSRIDVYVAPYYKSQGTVINVGRFSSGLASTNEAEFVATITKMKTDWDKLSFPELYVGAIRLYDLGYRKEAIYWFYVAQYRGRQFGTLIDRTKMGTIGDTGYELLQAQNAFYQLVSPFVLGYAFGDTESLIKIVEKVKQECRRVPDLEAIYPGVTFKGSDEWESLNKSLADRMSELVTALGEKKDEFRRQRIELGIEEKFAKLKSKDLPSPSGNP
jgi:hypothetical protein